MNALFSCILSFIVGVLLHQTSSFTQKLPPDIEEIIGTTIGVVGTIPVYVVWLYNLRGIKNPITWAIAAYLTAYVGVGCGVASGRLWDVIMHIDRSKA